MRHVCAVAVASLFAFAVGTSFAADALPKSGSISVHSGYMVVSESFKVGDNASQGHGTNRGVTFNDKGSGPLHLGPTDCFATFSTIAENTRVKGYCTFGDQDGDRIYTDFKGAFQKSGYVDGTHDVDGGTGKYAGITGTMMFRCKYVGTNNELECIQRLDYKLP